MAVNNGQHKSLSFTEPPQRVVSLVPSLTESLFDLGFGSSLVGATDFCVEPAVGVANLQRVGGTKNPRVEDILALKPDLVLANQEENSPQTVEALEAAGIRVWVSFPRSVHGAMDVLWVLVGIYRDKQAAIKLETIELSLGWLEQSAVGRIGKRYFCPIWYEAKSSTDQWWMTFNQNTYCHDLLRLCGGENVFARRERRYPLMADLGLAASSDSTGRDTRYPRVTTPEICEADPEIILLPSEPYSFTAVDRDILLEVFADTTAGRLEQVFLLDGSLITWHGTRLARSLQVLPEYFANPA